MSLRLVYETIEAQIRTIVDGNSVAAFAHFHTWNSDIDDLREGKDVLWPQPACLAEVIVESIDQLGNGNQRLNLEVNLHIVHKLSHAGAEFEQNFEVFDLAHITFCAMQQWKAIAGIPISEFIRIGETQDFHHTNLYHFIQHYRTTYIENALDKPVSGQYVIKQPPTTLVINKNPVPVVQGIGWMKIGSTFTIN